MIVLTKKKILLVSSLIMIFLFTFVIQIGNLNNNETVPTVSLPVSNKVIVLDAGHGVPDERSCLLTLKITLIFYKK